MKVFKYTALLGLWLLTSCGRQEIAPAAAPQTQYRGPQVERDLADIREDGVLRAIAIYNSTSYFLYRGEPMGFEYELLERLAESLDLELEVVVAKNINELFDLLNSGKGDLIAYGLTVTEPRRQIVSFTQFHYVTHQTLVQRRPEGWRQMPGYKIDKYLANDVIDLIGDTVHVPRRSSYYQRMINLEEELGGSLYLDTNVGEANTEDLIRWVKEGKIKYTVADHNIAAIHKTYYPQLDINTPVSFAQRIAWAVRKNSPQLLEAVNEWIKGIKKQDVYYVLYHKYFKNKKRFRRRIASEFYSRRTGKISRYDSLIKKFADSIGWDWRLLASQVYQESRFDPRTQSWAGAQGLLQIMPSTAGDLGIKRPFNPEQNLRAGTQYLEEIWAKWDEIPDSAQRIKFTMASYNCGYGHLLDAQRLAEKYGKDPQVYDDNVEVLLRKMSSRKYYRDPIVRYGFVRGEEPYQYVRDIFLRYHHYLSLISQGSLQDGTGQRDTSS
ncbi:MAG: transporter substrate-binding domain-containing protein [Schleiferiaceae bacterium]|nr:transporter substrate-binding domain-containing protein [Schleiferiaceae bacterium]MDR9442299.1 transporter substrate-binding domain-containing protein [Schleiferiaceae bacterium]